ncbi:MAG: GC-type dockerin domain-anchored protein [Phycisphaerales bacterium]
MTFGRFVVAALAATSVASAAFAQSTWTGAGDGTTWTSPANWQGGVPGAGDNVIINSGTPTLAVPASINGLTVTGGTLTLNAGLTINGAANFATINTIVGTGSITLSSTAAVVIAAGADRQIDVSLINGGMIELMNGSVLAINGTLTQLAGGSIQTHVDGVALSQIGRIATAGTATLSGTVRAVYDNGFTPEDCIFTYTVLTSQLVVPEPGLTLVAPVTLPISASIHRRATSLRLDPHNLADVAGLGGSVGSDGAVTADDLIVYLDRFFAQDLSVADVSQLGGTAGADGLLTADDIIVFLSAFVSGTCSGA